MEEARKRNDITEKTSVEVVLGDHGPCTTSEWVEAAGACRPWPPTAACRWWPPRPLSPGDSLGPVPPLGLAGVDPLAALAWRCLDEAPAPANAAVKATGVSVENLKDTFHNSLNPFTWDLPKHDKVVVHIPEGANDIQMGQIILQALVEGCQEFVTENRCDC
ncbi:hypothetical protein MRX96_007261 [Rhipicephalus microplus]